MRAKGSTVLMITAAFVMAGCQSIHKPNSATSPIERLNAIAVLGVFERDRPDDGNETEDKPSEKSLVSLLSDNRVLAEFSKGFEKAIASAISQDPTLIAAAADVDAANARVLALKSKKNFQFDATIYGGVEDVSDDTSGVAAVLTASRMVFDGGKIDATILAEEHRLAVAKYELKAKTDQRVFELLSLWANLDRYEKLSAAVESRLQILEPLIKQLERVTDAGIGDVTQVAAAQRTLSAILVTQTTVADQLSTTQANFKDAFGALPAKNSFEGALISKKMPSKISQKLKRSAPALLAQYSKYLASEADLAAVKARKSFDVGFEMKASKPFGGSAFDSDESIGLVLRKNFHDGGKLDADIKQAEAQVSRALELVRATSREGELLLSGSLKTISTMNKALALASENIKVTSGEVEHLRKQLVIGGSTLDNVLSAEARLYEAESQQINFSADKSIAQLTALSAVGMLSKTIGLTEVGRLFEANPN